MILHLSSNDAEALASVLESAPEYDTASIVAKHLRYEAMALRDALRLTQSTGAIEISIANGPSFTVTRP